MSELRDRIEGLIVDVLRDDLSPREAAGDILALPEIREALAGTGLLAVAEESRRVLIGQIKTAAEKIERLEGDLASARETWGAMLRERDEARAALAAAQAREAALVEWARKSGHRAGCDALRNWERDCDCGLRALLASPAPEVER